MSEQDDGTSAFGRFVSAWWRQPAAWWQFWHPMSGFPGGAILGLTLLAILLALT